MTEQEIKDVNAVVKAKLDELYPGIDDYGGHSLVFSPAGEFLGVRADKVFAEADQFDLAFV